MGDILESYIKRELPKIQQVVRRLLQRVDKEIDDLVTERLSAGQVRLFLTHISTKFHAIIKNGLEGKLMVGTGTFLQIVLQVLAVCVV